jgi:hypothetical protein
VDATPVFSQADIDSVLTRLCAMPSAPQTVEFVLAPDRRSNFDDRPSPLHLRMHDL